MLLKHAQKEKEMNTENIVIVTSQGPNLGRNPNINDPNVLGFNQHSRHSTGDRPWIEPWIGAWHFLARSDQHVQGLDPLMRAYQHRSKRQLQMSRCLAAFGSTRFEGEAPVQWCDTDKIVESHAE